jgi:sulfur carrier protein
MASNSVTIRANGDARVIDDGSSLLDFLAICGWKATQVVVECNGSIVPREQLGQVQLKEGDELEVIVPVAGG